MIGLEYLDALSLQHDHINRTLIGTNIFRQIISVMKFSSTRIVLNLYLTIPFEIEIIFY